MKIYNVIYESTNISAIEHIVEVNNFLDENKAKEYFKRKTQEIRKEFEEIGLEGYRIEETTSSYEIYLDGRQLEDYASIWIKESNTCDEITDSETVE